MDEDEVFRLIMRDDIESLREVVESGEDLDEVSSNGWTLLTYTACYGSLRLIQYLLRFGASPDARSRGKTPLHYAIAHKRSDIIEELISAGCDINAEASYGRTPLIIATKSEALDCMGLLIKAGSLVDKPDSTGKTPLYWAIDKGSLRAIEMLVKAGANVNLRVGPWSLLDFAIQSKKQQVMEYLIDNKASIESQSSLGMTPLLVAAQSGNVEAVCLLLRKGANIHHKNREGSTALHAAVYNGDTEIVSLLLDMGADPNCSNTRGLTPLGIAAAKGLEAVKDILLAHGAVSAP